MSEVGRVLGTDDASPLDFWVAVAEGHYLQLDDVVCLRTPLPDGTEVAIYGVVDQVRARYEGARFDSDVFRAAEGVLPVGIATAAHVAVTRVEPEVFVPPAPGQPVWRAEGEERERALYFDRMEHRFPAGLGRDGQVVWGNLEFLDGTRGGHVNIAGVSGVATKTSYALFLLYGLFHHPQASQRTRHARAVIFNVKGEDLLFLDRPNARLSEAEKGRYACLGLPAGPFQDVALWVPPARYGFGELAPSTVSRQEGVTPYAWSLREFCQRRFLSFLFADADSEGGQLPLAIGAAERFLAQASEGQPPSQSWVMLPGQRVTQFQDLVDYLQDHRDEVFGAARVSAGTVEALLRRLQGSVEAVAHLVRGDLSPDQEERHRIDVQGRQLNVIDIHALHDRAKRFVVGVVLGRAEQVCAAGGLEPHQGGGAGHGRAGPQPGRHPHRRPADGQRGGATGGDQRLLPGDGAAGHGRGRAQRVWLPGPLRPRPRQYPAPRQHVPAPAGAAGAPVGPVPLPGLGHPPRGSGRRPGPLVAPALRGGPGPGRAGEVER